eukprot:symbB.v1.2.000009.t1/scaffold5.1/size591573/9
MNQISPKKSAHRFVLVMAKHTGAYDRQRMLATFVGEGVVPAKESWPILTKEKNGIPIPITDYALAGISCAAVQSKRIGGGPEAPSEPKVRLARVGFARERSSLSSRDSGLEQRHNEER